LIDWLANSALQSFKLVNAAEVAKSCILDRQ